MTINAVNLPASDQSRLKTTPVVSCFPSSSANDSLTESCVMAFIEGRCRFDAAI